MTISSRVWDDRLKITKPTTKHKPVVLSDASVYDAARHYYTIDEIATMFNVNRMTVIKNHQEAYDAGRAEAFTKPRMLLAKIFSDFSHEDVNFARSDVPTQHLLKAIELHARKYEGLGNKVIIEGGAAKYDAVTSQVEIVERPVQPDEND